MIFVYALFDLDAPERIRYIGVSMNPQRRLREHVSYAVSRPEVNEHKSAWIRATIDSGSAVGFRVIEVHSTEENAYAAEVWWIQYLKQTTGDLTNHTAGGNHPPVYDWSSPANRERARQQMLQRWQDETFRERITASSKAYWNSEEGRAKASEIGKTRYQSHEQRLLTGVRTKETWDSKTEAEKQGIIRKYKASWTDERKAAMGAKTALFWSDPDNKKNRGMKIAIGKRLAKAKRNGWLLEVVS